VRVRRLVTVGNQKHVLQALLLHVLQALPLAPQERLLKHLLRASKSSWTNSPTCMRPSI
jgi:hypothetical protein